MNETGSVAPEEVVSGYLHAAYAQSLAEFGTPHFLQKSGGWILQREIPNSSSSDAMGCYPIFACRNWSELRCDLEDLGDNVIALSMVTDPFGDYDQPLLRECFSDRVKPFKDHFVVDLGREMESFVHPHHLRNARKAQRELRVELLDEPLDFLPEWIDLYDELVKRHEISGITGFSPGSFALQFTVPGLVAFRAVHDETTVGMLLWYVQGQVAYYHLGAYSALGYDLRASFALFSHALTYFAGRGLSWLNLGGAAGAGETKSSGLGRFKEGWSTGVRTAYFCGRIIDTLKYEELVLARGVGETQFFPAYRLGEFN